MNPTKRPVSVVIAACLYLAVGIMAFASHFHELMAFQRDSVWVELTEFLAIVAGVFIFRGHNWARWLALAWIVAHVILSAFHSLSELAVHSLLCVVIAWLLFRPAAARYFRRVEAVE
jgi:hypothetical protein